MTLSETPCCNRKSPESQRAVPSREELLRRAEALVPVLQ